MNLGKFTHIYLIGIGGIGMSGLARYFKSRGLQVMGYDKTATALTKKLEKENITVHFTDGVNQIPTAFKSIETTLVIYTPAVPANNVQLNYFQQNHFEVQKRARILAEIANQGTNIAIGGTHGKTTTSSLVAHIFNLHEKKATAFLGGIAQNFGSNFIAGTGDTIVLEADEFDRSFHQLHPDIALITSMDADHLDIYGNEESIQDAFKGFAQRIKPTGHVIAKHGLPIKGTYYGLTPEADFYADNIEIQDGRYHFSLHTPNNQPVKVTSGLPGRHNVENAVGAAAACILGGIPLVDVALGIKTFAGVARRFDTHINTANQIYIDDYAHHPKEIEAFLGSVKEMFPTHKITAIFQPHLFSRTKDFAHGFAEALALADTLWLMEIYPAREEPIPGITSEWLLKKVNTPNKSLCSKEEIFNRIKTEKPTLLVTLGAGDIDRLVEPIIQLLNA